MDEKTDKRIDDLEERLLKIENLLYKKQEREITIKTEDKTLVISSKNGLITDVKEK